MTFVKWFAGLLVAWAVVSFGVFCLSIILSLLMVALGGGEQF
jgi:hypothetical protein